MPNYRKNGYEDFTAELQGARIKRLLKMTGRRGSKWNTYNLADLLGIDQPAASRRLKDELGWRKEEIERIAETTGIPFDALYVYDNKQKLKSHNNLPVQLNQVTTDPKLLNHFVGVQLDSRTRDSVVRHLVKLEKFLTPETKEKIRKRRNKERDIRKKKEMLQWIFKKLHDETGVWPYELIRLKKMYGTYHRFQDRFNELKEKFKS